MTSQPRPGPARWLMSVSLVNRAGSPSGGSGSGSGVVQSVMVGGVGVGADLGVAVARGAVGEAAGRVNTAAGDADATGDAESAPDGVAAPSLPETVIGEAARLGRGLAIGDATGVATSAAMVAAGTVTVGVGDSSSPSGPQAPRASPATSANPSHRPDRDPAEKIIPSVRQECARGLNLNVKRLMAVSPAGSTRAGATSAHVDAVIAHLSPTVHPNRSSTVNRLRPRSGHRAEKVGHRHRRDRRRADRRSCPSGSRSGSGCRCPGSPRRRPYGPCPRSSRRTECFC